MATNPYNNPKSEGTKVRTQPINVTPQAVTGFSGIPPLMAWAFLWVILFAGASFEQTEQLSAAFAWLIFIAVLMAKGLIAFENLKNQNPFAMPTQKGKS